MYLIYAVYTVSSAISAHSPAWSLVALIPAAAAVGLLLRRSWGAYAAYATSLFACGSWVYLFVAFSLRSTDWPYPDLASNIVSLLPGTAWLGFWIFIAGMVYWVYHRLPERRDA